MARCYYKSRLTGMDTPHNRCTLQPSCLLPTGMLHSDGGTLLSPSSSLVLAVAAPPLGLGTATRGVCSEQNSLPLQAPAHRLRPEGSAASRNHKA